MFEREFRDVESRHKDILVFNFEIETSMGYEYLSGDEFVLFELVDRYTFSLLHLPNHISLSSVRIILTSPSGQKFESTIESEKWFSDEPNKILVFRNPTNVFPSKLNETGIWYIEFYFTTSETLWPWEYTGYVFDFDSYSQIRSTSRYPLEDYFKKGITVYTLSELVQLRAAKAAEKTAEMYEISIIIFGIAAAFTASAAFISYWNTTIYIKKRKEESIIHLIIKAIDPAILEFKELKNSIKKIKEGHIVPLPTNIATEDLSGSQWSDFRREFPIFLLSYVKFKNIQKYLKKKDEYNELREDCLKKIIEVAKRLDAKRIENFLIESMKKSRFRGTAEDFFKERIAEDLALNILHKEKTKNEFANDLFDKYYNSLLKIRNRPTINEKITKAIRFAEQLINFQKLHKKLNYNNRDFLMKKYHLYDGDLERYRTKTKKENN